MRKIVIVGCGGAGKSTLARQLGEVLHLPVVHLDAQFWKPGWKMISKAEEIIVLNQLTNQSSWIIDGNYNATMELRFEAADTIIFLDFPVLLCFRRVIKRFITYRGKSRPDMSPGCPEKVNWRFLGWILTYKYLNRPQVLKRINEHLDNRTVLIFKQPRQLKTFLSSLAQPSRANVLDQVSR
ncbi:DNA topology modulation protein [Spirosoma sp.]|uniref:DNA topology modulation protein n=1 Tax=Spirosoma sp. TaxID=1899569 RepID=UPI00261E1AE6|nr:DNA topology modulation protein [Spirosoma sp.]MCX6218513.1 DNA topology modulation protein [Spirosoma sp.]